MGQGEGEFTIHESGCKIVEILKKNESDYTDDLDHMRRIFGHVRCHLGQRPKGSAEDCR